MRKVSEVTTEQIREATSKGFVASLGYKSVSDTQFDLWLVNERHRVAELAIAKERERIIELIENWSWSFEAYKDYDIGFVEAIRQMKELIKGENK
jgi:hypothetical protein